MAAFRKSSFSKRTLLLLVVLILVLYVGTCQTDAARTRVSKRVNTGGGGQGRQRRQKRKKIVIEDYEDEEESENADRDEMEHPLRIKRNPPVKEEEPTPAPTPEPTPPPLEVIEEQEAHLPECSKVAMSFLPKEKGSLGMRLKLQGRLIVVKAIKPGTIATKKPVRAGDYITHIDDTPIIDLSVGEVADIIQKAREMEDKISTRFALVRTRRGAKCNELLSKVFGPDVYSVSQESMEDKQPKNASPGGNGKRRRGEGGKGGKGRKGEGKRRRRQAENQVNEDTSELESKVKQVGSNEQIDPNQDGHNKPMRNTEQNVNPVSDIEENVKSSPDPKTPKEGEAGRERLPKQDKDVLGSSKEGLLSEAKSKRERQATAERAKELDRQRKQEERARRIEAERQLPSELPMTELIAEDMEMVTPNSPPHGLFKVTIVKDESMSLGLSIVKGKDEFEGRLVVAGVKQHQDVWDEVGLREGDRLIKVNGIGPLKTYEDLKGALASSPTEVQCTFERTMAQHKHTDPQVIFDTALKKLDPSQVGILFRHHQGHLQVLGFNKGDMEYWKTVGITKFDYLILLEGKVVDKLNIFAHAIQSHPDPELKVRFSRGMQRKHTKFKLKAPVAVEMSLENEEAKKASADDSSESASQDEVPRTTAEDISKTHEGQKEKSRESEVISDNMEVEAQVDIPDAATEVVDQLQESNIGVVQGDEEDIAADAQGDEEDSAVDVQGDEEDSEANVQGNEEDSEADVQGDEEDSEADVQGDEEDSESDVQGDEEDSEANVQGNEEDSEADVQGDEEDSEADVQGNEENSEADVQGDEEDSAVDVQGDEEDSAVDVQGDEETSTADVQGDEEDSVTDVQGDEEDSESDVPGDEEDSEANVQGNEEDSEADVQGDEEDSEADVQGNEEDSEADVQGDEENSTGVMEIDETHSRKAESVKEESNSLDPRSTNNGAEDVLVETEDDDALADEPEVDTASNNEDVEGGNDSEEVEESSEPIDEDVSPESNEQLVAHEQVATKEQVEDEEVIILDQLDKDDVNLVSGEHSTDPQQASSEGNAMESEENNDEGGVADTDGEGEGEAEVGLGHVEEEEVVEIHVEDDDNEISPPEVLKETEENTESESSEVAVEIKITDEKVAEFTKPEINEEEHHMNAEPEATTESEELVEPELDEVVHKFTPETQPSEEAEETEGKGTIELTESDIEQGDDVNTLAGGKDEIELGDEVGGSEIEKNNGDASMEDATMPTNANEEEALDSSASDAITSPEPEVEQLDSRSGLVTDSNTPDMRNAQSDQLEEVSVVVENQQPTVTEAQSLENERESGDLDRTSHNSSDQGLDDDIIVVPTDHEPFPPVETESIQDDAKPKQDAAEHAVSSETKEDACVLSTENDVEEEGVKEGKPESYLKRAIDLVDQVIHPSGSPSGSTTTAAEEDSPALISKITRFADQILGRSSESSALKNSKCDEALLNRFVDQMSGEVLDRLLDDLADRIVARLKQDQP